MTVDLSLLNKIREDAGKHFEYQSDESKFGQVEHWMVAGEIYDELSRFGMVAGDCDDFAAICVGMCRKHGLPTRYVFCKTETGEGHLVCEVEGWIFDNRYTDVVSKDDLPYRWLSISGYSANDPWHLITSAEGD